MKLLLILAITATAATAQDLPGWKLVWGDEFDHPGLPDPAKWDYENGLVRNHELQFYTTQRRENARWKTAN